jgi:diguanylate cyclase (GGDEF)-like protein
MHALLEARLEGEGLALEHAFDGTEALVKVRADPPDLILLDLELPGMSGFSVCKALKGELHTSAVPVIFLSGKGDVESKVRGLDLGAIDFVNKPFEPAELRARVRAALRTKRLQDLLTVRAQVDGLTGLLNRSYFDRRLAEELAAARRFHRRVCLVILDIDHFKRINDRHGHPFGDRVLQALGEALTATVRATDAACRYGGEEFALILGETGRTDGLAACRRVQERIAQIELRAAGERVTLSASYGVVASDQFIAVPSPAVLIEAADSALYTAKRTGRNRVCAALESAPARATG